MEQLGQASGASHVYIFESQAINNQPKQRACWHEATNTAKINKQNLAYKECLPYWMPKLANGETINGLVSIFSESERLILEPQGIFSLDFALNYQTAIFWFYCF